MKYGIAHRIHDRFTSCCTHLLQLRTQWPLMTLSLGSPPGQECTREHEVTMAPTALIVDNRSTIMGTATLLLLCT